LEDDVRKEEELVPDFVGAQKLVREWRWLLIEMAVVSVASLSVVCAGTVFSLWSYWYRQSLIV